MNKNRLIAIEIIELFEDLLNEYNINIPDSDREGGKDEACIYGSNYYSLEDSITRILINKGKNPKCFSVSSKDLFNKKKNPKLKLSVGSILNNKKIKKIGL